MKPIFTEYKYFFRFIEIFILAVVYYLSFLILQNGITVGLNIVVLTLSYAFLGFFSIRVFKYFTLTCIRTDSVILKMACSNALGLFCTVLIVTLISTIMPVFGDIVLLSIFSSLSAFFILGAVLPAFKRILEVREERLNAMNSN